MLYGAHDAHETVRHDPKAAQLLAHRPLASTCDVLNASVRLNRPKSLLRTFTWSRSTETYPHAVWSPQGTAGCGTREAAKIRYARNSVCRQVPEAMGMIRHASCKADKARTLRDDCLISDIIATSTRGSRHEFCNEISANLSVRRVSYEDVRKHSHT